LQRHIETTGRKAIILFDGRDASGKGGTIRRVTRYMNEKRYRVVALGKPTEKQKSELFMKRYIEQFPHAGEIVLFDQLRRFQSREKDLLKQYKVSPVDRQAQALWHQYTVKKFQMLGESNRTIAPWTIIRSDNKKLARINCIRHILHRVEYDGKPTQELPAPRADIVVSGIDELKLMEDNLLRVRKRSH